jgi:hypothetical protein
VFSDVAEIERGSIVHLTEGIYDMAKIIYRCVADEIFVEAASLDEAFEISQEVEPMVDGWQIYAEALKPHELADLGVSPREIFKRTETGEVVRECDED